METGYKVVKKDLRSVVLGNRREGIQYKIGEYVGAHENLASLGLHPTVFIDLEKARRYVDTIHDRFPCEELLIYKCNMEGVTSKLPQPLLITGTLNEPVIWPPEPMNDKEYGDIDARWGIGTIMAEKICILEEVPYRRTRGGRKNADCDECKHHSYRYIPDGLHVVSTTDYRCNSSPNTKNKHPKINKIPPFRCKWFEKGKPHASGLSEALGG